MYAKTDPALAGYYTQGMPTTRLPRIKPFMISASTNLKTGAIILNRAAPTADQREAATDEFMGMWLRSGGNFNTGLTRAMMGGLPVNAEWTNSRGKPMFLLTSQAAADALHQAKTRGEHNISDGQIQVLAAKYAMQTMGGYFPESHVDFIKQDVTREQAAWLEQMKFTIMGQNLPTVQAESQHRSYGSTTGTAQGRADSIPALTNVESALTTGRSMAERISPEYAARIGIAPTKTYAEVKDMVIAGTLPLAVSDQTRTFLKDQDTAANTMNNLYDIAERIMTNTDPSWFGRHKAGFEAMYAAAFATDPAFADDLRLYQNQRDSLAAMYAKMQGESGGRLSDFDIERALKAMPEIGLGNGMETRNYLQESRALAERNRASAIRATLDSLGPITATGMQQKAKGLEASATARSEEDANNALTTMQANANAEWAKLTPGQQAYMTSLDTPAFDAAWQAYKTQGTPIPSK